MMDLGPHGIFILASYGSVLVVLTILIAWLILDGRKQKRLLADFEQRGITRRSRS